MKLIIDYLSIKPQFMQSESKTIPKKSRNMNYIILH